MMAGPDIHRFLRPCVVFHLLKSSNRQKPSGNYTYSVFYSRFWSLPCEFAKTQVCWKQTIITLHVSSLPKKKVSKQNIVFSYSPSSSCIATFPLSSSFLKVQNLAVLIILHIACKHLPCFFSWMTCQYCWGGSQECKQEGSKSGL